MSLRWDPLLVRALAEALNERLAGTHLRAVRMDGSTRELVLLFREATLAWSIHPTRGAPLFLPAADPAPTDLPVRARVRRVRSLVDERILVLELLPGRGHPARDVIVELLGNQWNAVVVEAADARIRHVLVRRDGKRPARVGEIYTPPPPPAREGAEAPLSWARWRELLAPAPPADRARTLVREVAWTSPINAPAFIEADDDADEALRVGWERWRALAHERVSPDPCLIEGEGGPQPYPWPLHGFAHTPVATLLDAFRLWVERGDQIGSGAAAAILPPERVEALERAADVALRRVTSLQAELDGLEDPARLRAQGDLLLARFAEVPGGAERVELIDFEGSPVTLTLDPTLPVHENAAAYYDRAARAERARERLPGLLREARAEATTLTTLLERTRAGDATAEELEASLPAPPTAAGRRGEDGPSLPYRAFRSSGGLEIRVGRGARTNDDLTFHHSAPGDVWLHARHAAGAHVILRWSQPGNPPARDLHEAAVLAALHSRARTSGTVPVGWTLRKYVRKPRGAAPGSVVPDRLRTVFVEPDPTLERRLADR